MYRFLFTIFYFIKHEKIDDFNFLNFKGETGKGGKDFNINILLIFKLI